jgi:hypothetical protein
MIHLVSDDPITSRIDASQKLLSMLGRYAEHYLDGVATGDEFWCQYSSYSDSIFADSRESVIPRIRQDVSGQTTMMTIFFTSTRLLVLEALPKGTKFNQNCFILATFPGLYNEKTRIHAKRASQLFQFAWTIRCARMVTRFLRNLPREALNQFHIHLILQISVRATFGCLAY